jgi:hypothetical protein
MELYKGLPIRMIEAVDKEGHVNVFGVTTEMVNELILNCVLDALYDPEKLLAEIEQFDLAYAYAVPQQEFEFLSDKQLINYINENIDDNYKTVV